MMHFADRLLERVAAKGAACVGVDPVLERLPDEVRTLLASHAGPRLHA